MGSGFEPVVYCNDGIGCVAGGLWVHVHPECPEGKAYAC